MKKTHIFLIVVGTLGMIAAIFNAFMDVSEWVQTVSTFFCSGSLVVAAYYTMQEEKREQAAKSQPCQGDCNG